MDLFLQLIFTAAGLGALYGALGIAFVVIHRMTGMVNFAQGDIAVAGAFGAVVAAQFLPPILAIAVGGVVGALVSVAMYFLAVRPLRSQGLLVQTIVTLGVGIVISATIQLIFGTAPQQFAPITSGPSLQVAGASMPQQTLWLLAMTVFLYISLTLFFDRTLVGKALSACAVNRYAAGVVGINLGLMATIAFAVSGSVAGIILSAQVPTSFISVGAGFAFGLKGFIAAILGGFDKLGLTLIGGFLIAFVEVYAARFISTAYADTIVFVLLIALLVLRPQGLSRALVVDRV